MKKYILAIDQGTTGTTSLLIDKHSYNVIDKVNLEFKQIYPRPGWVEHNLNDIWKTVEITISEVLSKNNISPESIISIGITNQRETTCAYTRDGEPLANAIVWQDRRTSEFCAKNIDSYKGLSSKTGLPLDPYFSATKMNWLLNNSNAVKSEQQNDNLLLSTIDTFLLYKMTNKESFKTEPSNASRTMLMNLDTSEWDEQLLNFFNISLKNLPQICDSFSNFGTTKGLSFLPDGIPISCILGDQQAALFGQAGFRKGSLKCTYGTGAFILLNTGNQKVYSSNGLLTTVAYRYKKEVIYALEGSCYIAGAAVQWLRDNIQIIKSAADVETLANSIDDLDKEMEHLMFLPFFTGIGSPYWNSEAKASIIGITRDTEQKHIARACLDGMALSINDSIEALIKDSTANVNTINVDGGACLNDTLMNIQAGFSQKEIVRPNVTETTAYGVALGSLVGIGELILENILEIWKEDKRFKPIDRKYYGVKKNQWNKFINKNY